MGDQKELTTEKAVIAKFEALREERDELANNLGARAADLQASLARSLDRTDAVVVSVLTC